MKQTYFRFRSSLLGVGFSLGPDLEPYNLKCSTKSLEIDFIEVQDQFTQARLGLASE